MKPAKIPSDSTETQYQWDIGKGRANNLDFIRLFLAIVVIFSHSFDLWKPGHEPLTRWTGQQTSLGSVAVAGFFLVSGYLITRSFLTGRGALDFFSKRVKRIYPGFIVAYFFSFCIVASLSVHRPVAPTSVGDFLNHILHATLLWEPFRDEAFAGNTIPGALNGSLWTIRYEFGCYMLVMFFGIIGLLRRRVVMLLLFLGLLLIQLLVRFGILAVPSQDGIQFPFLIFGHYNSFMVGAPHTLLRLGSFFIAGCVAYLYKEYVQPSPWLLFTSFVLVLVASLPSIQGLSVILPICGSYLLLYIVFSQSLRLPQAAKYGDFSYGVYLYAFPMQQLVLQFTHNYITPVALFLSVLVPTFILAFLSWHLVEKWFVRLRNPSQSVGSIIQTSPAHV